MEGLTYIFRVSAENLAGPGPFSEPTDRTVAMDAIRKFSVRTHKLMEQMANKVKHCISEMSFYLIGT